MTPIITTRQGPDSHSDSHHHHQHQHPTRNMPPNNSTMESNHQQQAAPKHMEELRSPSPSKRHLNQCHPPTTPKDTSSPTRKRIKQRLKFLHPLFSLRVLLCISAVAIIIFVGSATTLTGYFSIQSGLSDIVEKFQLSLNLRISGFVDRYMLRQKQTLRTMRSLIHDQGGIDEFFKWDLKNRTAFFTSFVTSQRISGEDSGIFFASEATGHVNFITPRGFCGVTVPSTNATANSTSLDLRHGPFNLSTNHADLTYLYPNYDMYERPWYKELRANTFMVYDGIINNSSHSKTHCILQNPSNQEFRFSSFTSLSLTPTKFISLPVVDDNNTFRGLMALLIETQSMSAFLRSLAGAPDHHFFLLQRDGLVASSTRDRSIQNEIMTKIRCRYGESYKALSSDQSYDSFQDAGQLIAASFLEADGWELIVVVVLPSSLLYEKVLTMTLLSISVIVILMFLSSVVGLGFSYFTTRPLLHIAREMKKAKNLKIESIRLQKGSWIYEYNAIIDSFESLVRRLEEYRSFLPDYIIPQNSSSEGMSSEHFTPVQHFVETPVEDVLEPGALLSCNSGNDMPDNRLSVDSVGSDVEKSTSPVSPPRTVLHGRSKLRTGLSQSNMGVFFFRLHNAHRLSMQRRKFLSAYEEIIHIISSVASLHGAFIDRMDYNQILIIFPESDASICCAKMLKAAVNVDSRIKKLNSRHGSVSYTISISYGSLQSGVIGSHRNKTYTTIGRTRDNCWLLCKSGARLKSRIVFDESVFSLIDSKFNNKHTTYLSTPIDVLLDSSGRAIVMYELIDRIILSDEEWLYTMAFNHAQESHRDVKEAFDALLQGRISEAEEKFEQVKHFDSIPSQYLDRMLELCEYWRKRGEDSMDIVRWIDSHTKPRQAWKNIPSEDDNSDFCSLANGESPVDHEFGFSLLYPKGDQKER